MKPPRIILALASLFDAIVAGSKPAPCKTCKQKLGSTWDCKECDEERAEAQSAP